MIRLNIKSTEASIEDISAWFAARNAEFHVIVTDVKDWWSHTTNYQIYDIDILDEYVAMEFRLTFDSKQGESYEHTRHLFEEMLFRDIQENMTKLIDEQVTQDLLELANTELKISELMKVYDVSDLYPTTIPKDPQ